jgi:hypothetical protein
MVLVSHFHCLNVAELLTDAVHIRPKGQEMHQLSRKSAGGSGRKSRRCYFYSTEQDLMNGENRCPERKKMRNFSPSLHQLVKFENMFMNRVRAIFFPFLSYCSL